MSRPIRRAALATAVALTARWMGRDMDVLPDCRAAPYDVPWCACQGDALVFELHRRGADVA